MFDLTQVRLGGRRLVVLEFGRHNDADDDQAGTGYCAYGYPVAKKPERQNGYKDKRECGEGKCPTQIQPYEGIEP